MRVALRALVSLAIVAGVGACVDDAPPLAEPLADEELLDPAACASCHPGQHAEWSGSMHAYASTDPVFRAMNARGQRETDGALGDFCVQCHAPMAVRTGATTDGLNLDEVPDHLQGVTCYFCHSVTDVQGIHNNPLLLADDGIMRGGIADPRPAGAHDSAYSPWHDRDRLESAQMCGACHDVVLPNGVPLEQSYAQWNDSVYADPEAGIGLSCNSCHMRGRDGLAAELPGMPTRRIHSHAFPAVDVALTPFPHAEEQRRLVQEELDRTLFPELCVFEDALGTQIRVTLENAGAGHTFPSGSTKDRRVWVEVIAYREGVPIFESGTIEEGEVVREHDDPNLWDIGEFAYREDGTTAHMFWDVARLESTVLPAPVTLDRRDPRYYETHVSRFYDLGALEPDRVTMRVRLRPFGLDVIDDLIASGDLEPGLRERVPTFTLGSTRLEWQLGAESSCIPERSSITF